MIGMCLMHCGFLQWYTSLVDINVCLKNWKTTELKPGDHKVDILSTINAQLGHFVLKQSNSMVNIVNIPDSQYIGKLSVAVQDSCRLHYL